MMQKEQRLLQPSWILRMGRVWWDSPPWMGAGRNSGGAKMSLERIWAGGGGGGGLEMGGGEGVGGESWGGGGGGGGIGNRAEIGRNELRPYKVAGRDGRDRRKKRIPCFARNDNFRVGWFGDGGRGKPRP